MQTKSNEIIKGYEQSLVKIILYCISELPFSFGTKKVIGVLRGSKSAYVIDHELYQLEMYGILPDFKVKYLKSVIEKMLEQGLLVIKMVSDFRNLPTLILTQEGKDFLDGKSSTNVDFAASLSDGEVILLDEQELVLFENLRQLRRDLAFDKEIPAYMVCSTISLRELAKSKPKSELDLPLVNGIGESFVLNYGADFLKIIELYNNF
ncbi:RQC domain-containing protein [Chloroflexota bacterium]